MLACFTSISNEVPGKFQFLIIIIGHYNHNQRLISFFFFIQTVSAIISSDSFFRCNPLPCQSLSDPSLFLCVCVRFERLSLVLCKFK